MFEPSRVVIIASAYGALAAAAVAVADQAWCMIPQVSRDDYLEWVQAHNH